MAAFPPKPDSPFPVRVLGTAADYGFLDPVWLSRFRPDRGDVAAVAGGRLRAFGRDHPFADGAAPPDGTEMRAWFDLGTRVLVACPEAEHRARAAADEAERARILAEQAAAQARAVEARRRAREEATARARDWLGRFDPPFRWAPGRKPVLGGLMARSAGDGRSRASVVHVMLADGLSAGRLSRKAGEMLCAPGTGSFGNDRAGGTGDPLRDCPTCRRCIDLAARYLRPAPAASADPGTEDPAPSGP